MLYTLHGKDKMKPKMVEIQCPLLQTQGTEVYSLLLMHRKKKSTGKKGNGGVLREYTQLITLVQIEFVQEEYP